MNKVIQTITFCADPELKTYGSDNKPITTFNAAVNKRFKKEGQPDADFFRYTAFGKTAEFICKYFKKGSKALITGEINNNNYEKDGVMHYGTQILIDNVEFFGSKKTDEDSTATSAAASTTKSTGTTSTASVDSYSAYADF